MVAEFVKVCGENEIEEKRTKTVTVNGLPVILARENGNIYALEGLCSHDGGEFKADEKLIDNQIVCPRHGARFSIKTGDATQMPAIVGIETYKVKVENGDVYVAIEED